MTSNTAPALPHASVVAVYPALFHIIGGNWESIRFLRHSSGYPSLIDIFENRSRMFLEQPTMFGNSTLDRLQMLPDQRISDSQWRNSNFLKNLSNNFY